MMKAWTNVKVLAIMTGRSLIRTPYMSHSKTPALNIENMPDEMSLADLVLQVFSSWGKKDMVERAAAVKPKIVM